MEKSRSPLVDEIIAILNRYDPMGLAPGSNERFAAPRDEYEPEARDLAAVLHTSGTLTGDDVNEVWRKWFDQPAGPAESAAAIAAEVRALSVPALTERERRERQHGAIDALAEIDLDPDARPE